MKARDGVGAHRERERERRLSVLMLRGIKETSLVTLIMFKSSKMSNTLWFQPLKCEDLLLFSLLCRYC